MTALSRAVTTADLKAQYAIGEHTIRLLLPLTISSGEVSRFLEALAAATSSKQVVFDAAVDLGPPGEDNDYGHGMIDAYEAVQIALATLCAATPPIMVRGAG